MILEINSLSKSYGKKKVLDNIDLTMEEGTVLAILGKNGAGKSTMIKSILGFNKINAGEVYILGDKPSNRRDEIGYLSENIALYPYLSAVDNIKIAALSSNIRLSKDKITDILETVNLTGSENKKIKEYSLGMKRRLQLAMAMLIKDVKFLILDEPTNGLDINGMLWTSTECFGLKNI